MTKTHRRSESCLVIFLALAATAFAIPCGAAGADPAATADSSSLDEVVVTARKRSESIIDVPESITAFGTTAIQDFDIQSFADYATKAPNLGFTYGQSAFGVTDSTSIAIRGIAGAGTTGFYIDETPIPITVDPRVVDIDRIEVLKGPQGTLYGESSMGGNVRLITTKPKFDGDSVSYVVQGGGTSGATRPDYGGTVIGNVVVVPDVLAVRATAFDDYDAGFLTRTFPAANGPGRQSVDNQGSINTYGASVSALFKATDRFDVAVKFLTQEQIFDGLREAYAPLPAFKPVYILNRTTDTQESASNHFGLASVVLDYHADNLTLTSSTSYFYNRNFETEDGTEGTNEFFETNFGATLPATSAIVPSQYTDTSQVVEEVRLSATLSSALSVITGVYYSHTYLDTGFPDFEATGLAATGLYPNNQLALYDVRLATVSAAAFGEVYYKFLDKFTLTLGGRYFDLDQRSRTAEDGFFFGGPSDSGILKSNQTGFSPKAALAYAITDDSNIYASYSRGFRPGGPQAPVPSVCLEGLSADGLSDGAYKADTVDNYEIGAKKSFLDGRAYVTLAAFQVNWNNIQQNVVLPCGDTVRTNTGDGRIRGGEVEVNGHLLPNFDVRIGLGAEDPIITNPGATTIQSGERIFQVPRLNGTAGFTYTFNSGSNFTPYVSVDYSYVGDRLSADNSAQNAPLVEPAYSILNARIGAKFGNSELTLYGKNVLNEKANLGDVQQIAFPQYIKNASGQTVPYLEVGVTPPVQIGLQFKQHF